MASRGSRLLRFLRAASAVVALTVTFVIAAVVGLALHVNLPQLRRLSAHAASAALSSALTGKVEAAPFDRVSLRGLRTSQATLFDAYGHRVLTLYDVRIGFDPVLLVEELLSRDDVLTLIVYRVRVERAEADITPDPKTGEPTIVGAFAPRASAVPAQAGKGRPVRLFLSSIEVGRGTLHGIFRDVPPLDADVTRVHGQLVATPAGVGVDVTRFGAVLRGFGADARGTGTLSVRAPGATRGTFEGFFGDIELGASALIKGSHLELSADIPSASPAAVKRFIPDWPLVERVSAHVEAKGDFPNLTARARVSAGDAVAMMNGPVVLGEKRRATLEFSGEHLDARVLSPQAPATDLVVSGNVDAEDENGKFAARFRAHTAETEIGGYPVPAMDAEATLENGILSGTGDVHEPGMPTHVTFRTTMSGVADVDAEAKAFDVRSVRQLPHADVRGRGGARLRAHVENGNLTVSLDASTGNVDVASVAVSNARVSLQAHGPLASPSELQGTLHATAKSVSRGGYALDDVEVNARGSLNRATFDAGVRQEDGPEVALAGTIAVLGHPLLRDTKISVKRDPVLVEGNVSEFDPDANELYIKDIRATGAGGPLTGSARLRPNLVEIEADGENLDLDALSRAFALPRGTLGGRARLSLHVAAGRDITKGHLRIGAGDLTIGTLGGVSAQVYADLDGEQLTGGASGLVRGLGTFGASWEMSLGGPAFDIASLRSATGRAELQLSDAELGRLGVLLPSDGPVERIEGRGYARLEFTRDDARTALPDLKITAATRGLGVTLRGGSEEKPKKVEEIDVNASGTFDGGSGETSGNTLLFDSHGDLVLFTGTLRIDVPRLLREPARALSQLLDTPIEARASVPHRPIAELPEIVRVEGVDGDVSGDLLVSGTLVHPTLRAGFDGRGLVAKGSRVPVDLHGEAKYDWTQSALRGRLDAKIAQNTVLTAILDGTQPSVSPADFRGTLRVDANGLPLDLVGALSQNNVRGTVFGTATLSAAESGGALLADLRVSDALVDRTPLGEGRLHIQTDASSVSAKLGFSGARGRIDADGSATLSWTGALPSLSDSAPLRGQVVAKDFSAAAFSPFVSGVLSRLGGRIDANVTVDLEPRKGDGAGPKWSSRVDGSAVLRDGTVLIDVLGLDVQSIALRARATGKGGTTHLAFADVKGKIRSNSENIRGSADLELDGVKLVSGHVSAYADDMPILFRGAPQGRATGNASLQITREPDQMLVDVEVPTMKLTLPESSARSVIDVADNPEIQIIQNAAPVEQGARALPWSLLVHLGNAVAVQRSDVELNVTGTPVVNLGAETQVTGTVDLVPGGHVPVLGQVFTIERGVIAFDTGKPDNPRVNVTAVWRAANDTLVYVEVTGTLREAEVALRSDPPLPEPEVFALLFGGSSSDESAMSQGGGEGGSAAGTAALQGPVSQLNRLFGQSPVELRVGSTSEAQPRYTAAVRVRENLWFEASTYQQSEYTSGSSSDRSVVSGTIDYRFSRKWSLRTEAGTVGGALDLLWQHRY